MSLSSIANTGFLSKKKDGKSAKKVLGKDRSREKCQASSPNALR
jgi:hypothetical protein